jgi:uncharacterized protein (DUF697 family)
MDPETRDVVHRHAAAAAAASFIAQPIPAADELVVIPIHYLLASKMLKMRGVASNAAPWRPLHAIIWGGAALRLVVNFTMGLVPLAGAFSNALTAIALTQCLGRYLDAALPKVAASPVERREEPTVEASAAAAGA